MSKVGYALFGTLSLAHIFAGPTKRTCVWFFDAGYWFWL